jgi:hypothetical protein
MNAADRKLREALDTAKALLEQDWPPDDLDARGAYAYDVEKLCEAIIALDAMMRNADPAPEAWARAQAFGRDH